MTAWLFCVTLFVSAALLFVVQPLVGKQLLPILGGSPAVWNACLLFFQGGLLLGYYYGHFLQRLSGPTQRLVHSSFLGLSILSLVFREPLLANFEQIPKNSDDPTLPLLLVLLKMVGLPFVVLSATAPLLQRWYAQAGSRDPYFLYAASNIGSLVGLLGYPFLVESRFDLDQQRLGWVIGLVALALFVLCCAGSSYPREQPSAYIVSTFPLNPPSGPVPFWYWVFLAALPSSWLLAVTTHLTTDIAPVPLLWVVPLALYLLSFVIVFAWWPLLVRLILARAVPMLLMFLAIALLSQATEPIALVAGIHLMSFFGVALLCHGELATTRPEAIHLTKFYLAMSLGGVVGGAFMTLIAPLIFARLGHWEYPLLMLAICLVRPDVHQWHFGKRDAIYLALWGSFTLALNLVVPLLIRQPAVDDPDALLLRMARVGLMLGLPVVFLFALVWNPIRFATGLVLLLLIAQLNASQYGQTLHLARNFFGTLKVTRSTDGHFTQLVHGTTQHGQQRLDDREQPKPLMYYYPTGPIGRLIQKLPAERKQRVGVVGLGCGAMAAYIEPGQQWTFFEIDPGVVRIAEDERFFSYLKQAKQKPRIMLGDARRTLNEEPDESLDFLVLDAFSSDAIPVHLLTREALVMYARKLTPRGVMAFHLSNRYLDLPPLVARLGDQLEPKFFTRLDEDSPSDKERTDGKFASTWAVLFRDEADLGDAKKELRFQRVSPEPGPIWTDRFSNLLSVWK